MLFSSRYYYSLNQEALRAKNALSSRAKDSDLLQEDRCGLFWRKISKWWLRTVTGSLMCCYLPMPRLHSRSNERSPICSCRPNITAANCHLSGGTAFPADTALCKTGRMQVISQRGGRHGLSCYTHSALCGRWP